jgi:Na+/H+ antiporter NhaD/arsenite permease-like protein
VGDPRLWQTLLLFILTYAGLALGKVPGLRMDRVGIALVGATLTLALGLLTLDQAVSTESIDYRTLVLLFGMMIVVGSLRLSGIFERLTQLALGHVRTPRALLAVTIFLSGTLSAFLVNDIVCLALTPLVQHLARRLRCSPLPHLIALATAANIGSTGTITGNPQNMFIGSHSHIPYFRFALRLMPVALLGLVVDYLLIAFLYRNRLRPRTKAEEVADPAPPENEQRLPVSRTHRRLQARSALVTLATVVLFFTGLPIELVALAAAAVLLLSRLKPERLTKQIDWGLLVMFSALFVVVHAFQKHVVATWHVEQWHWLFEHPVDLLSVASAALSNLVSNVPAVLLFEPVMNHMPAAQQETSWLALAMSSTLAGNLTVLGSVANLIVVEVARREGVVVSFWEYSKVGIPVTILTLLLGIAWLGWVVY